MQLIGHLDSPFVRRVAISAQLLDVPFTHRPVSVLREFDTFAAINPVVKAPSWVTDDGTVLMDSTLILEHLSRINPNQRQLMPVDAVAHQRALRQIGLALAACEKSVALIYERVLRPSDKAHAAWIDRVRGQCQAALTALDASLQQEAPTLDQAGLEQAALTAAVSWTFIAHKTPEALPAQPCPALVQLTQQAEALPVFRRAPMSESTYPVTA